MLDRIHSLSLRCGLVAAAALSCSAAAASGDRPPSAQRNDAQQAAINCEVNLTAALIVRQKTRVTIAVDGDRVATLDLKASPASAALVRRMCRGIDDTAPEPGDSALLLPAVAASH